jgi:hypothetical protein
MVERIYRDDDTSVARGFEIDRLNMVVRAFLLLGIFGALTVFASSRGEAWIFYLMCGCLTVILAMVAWGTCYLFNFRGDVVVISPEGMLDRRVSEQTIPWSAITDIRTFSDRRFKTIILTLDPVFDATFKTKVPRSRLVERAMGAEGVMISAGGLLHVSHGELLTTARAYAEAAKARPAEQEQSQTDGVGLP